MKVDCTQVNSYTQKFQRKIQQLTSYTNVMKNRHHHRHFSISHLKHIYAYNRNHTDARYFVALIVLDIGATHK